MHDEVARVTSTADGRSLERGTQVVEGWGGHQEQQQLSLSGTRTMWRDPPADGQPGNGARQDRGRRFGAMWRGGDVEGGASPVQNRCS